jgi:SHOCT-like protein
MSSERKQILNMLAEGKITADEAERLLSALEESAKESTDTVTESGKNQSGEKKEPKYLKIQVHSKKDGSAGENVNIKIPLMLIKTGIKLGSLVPDHAKEKISSKFGEKGINVNIGDLDMKSIAELVNSLEDMNIDVDDGVEKVRIYCE